MNCNRWNIFGTRIGTRAKGLTSFPGTRGTRICTDVSCGRTRGRKSIHVRGFTCSNGSVVATIALGGVRLDVRKSSET